MRRGKVKPLILLGFLVLIGISFMFLTGSNSKKQTTLEKQTVAQSEMNKENELTENEKEVYMEKLTELKGITVKLNQKDTEEFKEQTKEAFTLLADLINELPQNAETKSEVTENTTELKKAAGEIALFDNEKKVVEQVKKGFNAAAEAVDEATGDIDEEKYAAKKFLENVEKKLDQMENKIAKVDEKNYKPMTKELLMDFHSLNRYMYKEMNNSDIMATTPEAKKALNEESIDSKKQAMNEKEETAKNKKGCGCNAHVKDDEKN